MKTKDPEAKDVYFAQAQTWADDKLDSLISSRRTAWLVASVSVAVAMLEALALISLTPLKTVVPYTLLVDRQTGYVQALDPLAAKRVAPDSALTQSFLVQYVIAREGFDFATVQSDFRKTMLWSSGSARTDYNAAMQVTNPESPLVRLPRNAVVETRVRSVSAFGNRSALVRFDTARRDRNGPLALPRGWVAIITYRFSNEPMSTEDRYLNPLGFQVLSYRRSAETPPVDAENANTQRQIERAPGVVPPTSYFSQADQNSSTPTFARGVRP